MQRDFMVMAFSGNTARPDEDLTRIDRLFAQPAKQLV